MTAQLQAFTNYRYPAGRLCRCMTLVDWRTRGNSLVGRAQPSKAEAQFRNLFPAPALAVAVAPT